MKSPLPLSRTFHLNDGELKARSVQIQEHEATLTEVWPGSDAWNAWQREHSLRNVTIACNGLIDRVDLPETDQMASHYSKSGYKCVKVKVGTALDLERARIENVKLQIPFVRVDANRSLSLAEAETLFDDLEIEYAEEPLIASPQAMKTIENLEEFSMRTCVGYALDETLAELKPRDLPRLDGLKALVIKPHRLSGQLEDWIAWANENKKTVVISHMFDSPVGLHHLAGLAEQFHGFHGLDPSFLHHNPFTLKDGSWSFTTTATFQWFRSQSKDL